MKEISEKLHKKVMEDFRPIADLMAREGCKEPEIVRAFQSQLKLKTQQFYERNKGLRPLSDILGDFQKYLDRQSADSKAELIFYNLLDERGIKCEFQFKIGPYRADYLFAGFLVVEIDGPQHEKKHDARRDKYMRDMGYKILRIPTWVLVSCPDAVVDEIEEAIQGIRIIPKQKARR